MRTLACTAILLAAACSSPARPAGPPAADEPLRLQPPDAVVLESLIGPNVVAVMKTRPEDFMALRYVDRLLGASPAPCWTALERKLVATYQLQVPATGAHATTSYFVLQGELRQQDVVACVPAAITAVPLTVEQDGGLVAIKGPEGATTYAAWRGPFVIVGARDLVDAARTAPVTANARWHALLGGAPAAPIWWASEDALLAGLLGVPTTHYTITFERLEASPTPYFAGRAVISYASPGDAAIAARRIKQGELEPPFDAPELASSFKRFSVKQTGTTVEVGFDLGMFGGITVESLGAITAKAMAALHQP